MMTQTINSKQKLEKVYMNAFLYLANIDHFDFSVSELLPFQSDNIVKELEQYGNFIHEMPPKESNIFYGNYFYDLWTHYAENNAENVNRLYQAMLLEYNPIENYNGKELTIDANARDTITVDNTPTGKTTQTTSTDIYGLNSGETGADSETVTSETSFTSRKDTNKTTFGKTLKATIDGTESTGYNEVLKHYTEKRGNLGIATAADMLKKEIEIRTADILKNFVSEFVNRYFYYCDCEGDYT